MNLYTQLQAKQSKERNDFPMKFAFSEKQFREGMEKLGLDPINDKNKVVSIGSGGFIRKSDKEAFYELFTRHMTEQEQASNNPETGDQYLYDMFYYELGNHEWCYTHDITATLECCGYTVKSIEDPENARARTALTKALRQVKSDQYEDHQNYFDAREKGKREAGL